MIKKQESFKFQKNKVYRFLTNEKAKEKNDREMPCYVFKDLLTLNLENKPAKNTPMYLSKPFKVLNIYRYTTTDVVALEVVQDKVRGWFKTVEWCYDEKNQKKDMNWIEETNIPSKSR